MPDPWFKNRHKKRRLLQPVLVQQIADRMQPGARFFVMSDVKVPPPLFCAIGAVMFREAMRCFVCDAEWPRLIGHRMCLILPVSFRKLATNDMVARGRKRQRKWCRYSMHPSPFHLGTASGPRIHCPLALSAKSLACRVASPSIAPYSPVSKTSRFTCLVAPSMLLS